MENKQTAKTELGESEVRNLYNLTLSFSFAIKEAIEMYSYRVLDLNQYITRTADLSQIFITQYNELTENGTANLTTSLSKLAKDHEKGKATA